MKTINSSIRFRHAVFATVAFLTAASPAFAQDKATLDLLVKKGVITQAEADGVAKSSATVPVTAKDSAVKALQLEGMIQIQGDFLTTNDHANGASNPTSTDQFQIRRVYLGAVADLGNGWGAEVLFDFAANNQAPTAGSAGAGSPSIGQNSFEKIIVTKKIPDYGLLTVGYRKVDFDQEEMTSSTKLKAIERSPATRYFDENYDGVTSKRIAFGNRHTGLFWNGNVTGTGTVLDGAYYNVEVTDGIQNQNLQVTNANNLGLNRFAYWLGFGYQGAVRKVKYDVGVHSGVSQNQNNNGAAPAQANAEWAYNPYVTLDYGNFELSAEFLQAWVQRGKQATALTATEATPYGFNITPSYKISPQWELSFRYSYLDTNGRGTNISDVVRDGNNPTYPGGGTTNLFNNVSSYYFGVNWYIIGSSLKLSAGYEINEFYNRQAGALGTNFTGPRAISSGVRTQLQVQF